MYLPVRSMTRRSKAATVAILLAGVACLALLRRIRPFAASEPPNVRDDIGSREQVKLSRDTRPDAALNTHSATDHRSLISDAPLHLSVGAIDRDHDLFGIVIDS